MGFFGKKKTKIVDPWAGSGFDWMRGAIGSELKGMRRRAPKLAGRLEEAGAPTKERFTQYLQEGTFRTPEEQEALGFQRQLMGTQAGQFMGGYDPELQRRATMAAYGKNAPQAVASVLQQAGLGAPGIGHGRVRAEAGRVAGDLYDELQQALAQQNQFGAQFGRGAEQMALQTRMAGAGGLERLGGFGQLMQRQMGLTDYLRQLEMAPEQARMAMLQPMLNYDPRMWQMQRTTEYKPGFMDKASSVLGAAGQLGGILGGMGGFGGFSSMFGGGQPSNTQAGGGGWIGPNWTNQTSW